jgi:predicted transcriptional regulator
MKQVTYKIDDEAIEKIKILAAKKRSTLNDIFVEAINDILKKYERSFK